MTKKKESSVKEVEQTKTKAPLEKVSVSFKQVGKNLNLVIGEEKITRTGEKEELTVIKEAVKTYDAKPTKSNLESLKKLLKPVTVSKEKEVENTKAQVKAEKNKSKESSKNISKEAKKISSNLKSKEADIDTKKLSKKEEEKVSKKAQEVKTIQEPAASTHVGRRRGEW